MKWTELNPGTNMTYIGREYGEKNEHMLMNAVITQMKSYDTPMKKKEKYERN